MASSSKQKRAARKQFVAQLANRVSAGVSPYDPICRHWILRILVEMGVINEILLDSFCSDRHLLSSIGLDPLGNRGDAGYDAEAARREVLEAYRLSMKHRPSIPDDAPLIQGSRMLQGLLGLSDLDVRIVVICALARSHTTLGQALDLIGRVADRQIIGCIATLLDEPFDAVAAAFSKKAVLHQSCLVRLGTGPFSFVCKLELIDGLEDRLYMPPGDVLDIFSGSFTASPTAVLKLEDFKHLEPHCSYLAAYLGDCVRNRAVGVNVLIYGDPGTGKTQLTRALASHVGAALFEVSSDPEQQESASGNRRLASYALAQRLLSNRSSSLILFDEIEDLQQSGPGGETFGSIAGQGFGKAWLNQLLESNPVPAIWVSNRIDFLDAAHLRRFSFHVHVGTPPLEVRSSLLQRYGTDVGLSSDWCRHAARHEFIGPALAQKGMEVSAAVLRSRPDISAEKVVETVLTSTLRAFGVTDELSGSSNSGVEYDPALVSTSLPIADLVDHLRDTEGARLCFFGPPGTGKSAFAAHIAQALGRPLLQKRSSDLLGSYVGQSERAIARAFEAAERDRAVLILDEVDSFLMKRHAGLRQWETSLVNEFLQQIDALKRGCFIATTNFIDHLDEAVLRRFDLKVEFGFLAAEQSQELLLRACERLGLSVPSQPRFADKLQQVTAGDFSTVLRQAKLNPIRNVEQLVNRLRKEIDLRRGSRRSIGFLTPQGGG